MKFKLILFIFLIFPNIIFSAFENDYTGSARVQALNFSIVGAVNDIDAIVFNSAGLIGMEFTEILLSYSRFFIGIDYGKISDASFSVTYPCEEFFKIGVHFNRFSADIYSENTFITAFAFKINKKFSTGINFKYLFWDTEPVTLYQIGDVAIEKLKGYGIGFDIDFLFKIREKLNLGLCFVNVNEPSIESKSSAIKERVPFIIKTGFGWNMKNFLLLSQFEFKDFSFSHTSPIKRRILKRFGLEYPISKFNLNLRGGISFYNLFENFNFSAGIGYKPLKKFNFEIDYGFLIPFFSIKDTLGNHSLSIKYKF